MLPTILTFVRYYLPGYKSGGPIQSIATLVEHLGDEFDFRIVTSDRDAGDHVPYSGIDYRQWQPVGKAQVRYLAPREKRLGHIARLMRETPHDVVYLNSFFDPCFTTLPVLARRLRLAPQTPGLIAPRGEFSSGALGIKWLKKRVFLAAARGLALHSGLAWQASSDYEAKDIRRVMDGQARDVRIAPDLVRRGALRVYDRSGRRSHTPLRVVFLSRISPMKNLLFALDVLARVTVPVEFTIIGPVSDPAYWVTCRAAIKALPDHVQVKILGPVPHDQVVDTLAEHDLFFLPTYGENYGHAIAEALQAGLPVLISDQTPWRGLAREGVGQDLPLAQPERFVRYIEKISNQSAEEWKNLQHCVIKYTKKELYNTETIKQMRDSLCLTNIRV